MRLWIAVLLPLLPLESLRPRWLDPGAHAVIEHNEVLTLSAEAALLGVKPRMRRAGVAAIAPDTRLHERDRQAERDALQGVALCLLQYTPEVALAGEAGLVLDVSASLAAFGGRLALCRRVRGSVLEMGYSLRLGMATSAQAASLFALNPLSGPRRSLRPESMRRRLDALPALLLPAAWPHRDWLDGIGCRTLADLRRLPRAGIKRRADVLLLDQLDRAYGEAPELHDWVQAPPQFDVRLELPERIEHAEAVLFAARRLLMQLIGWLVARHLAVSRLTLWMEHERGRQAVAPTALDITLAEPAWREDHLLRLLKERLGRLELRAPVIALRLEAQRLEALAPPSASLFPEPGGTVADYHRLLELLSARLGMDNVLTPALHADHRPEIRNRWMPAGLRGKRSPALPPPIAERPFWLLETPLPLLLRDGRPFYGSPLQLLAGPERIETGWWDADCALRDYYIARGADHACYWIFRERAASEERWFLHGLFA
ncbi:Y-family DNA polymerase [Noviherbaspirillum pedocola]|uniref:DNA polymerase Y family protein n=1 Tax=Noviherbaspirillum pedocola TaxID=2801341 RepID=A0A934SSU1_9BURK|nr:DNA polymerase Y family protein [Noviherbaspirillum pedocola]MBK4734598.1 DNA polymerase Y family protein [Noviherbaspirillum pedocola]